MGLGRILNFFFQCKNERGKPSEFAIKLLEVKPSMTQHSSQSFKTGHSSVDGASIHIKTKRKESCLTIFSGTVGIKQIVGIV